MDYQKLNKVGNMEKNPMVCTQLSCGDPQENLCNCILSGDLTSFSGLLADVAAVDDGHLLSLPDDEKQLYPLAEDHWINQLLKSTNPKLADQLLLQLAVKQSNPEFTRLLVRAGARADVYNDFQAQAVIHTAVLSEYSDLHLPLLLNEERNRADVNCTLQPGGQTALHLAAEKGKQFCLDTLLEQPDTQVDARDSQGGRTPLLLAARGQHIEAVRKLIEHGANPDLKCGKTTPRSVMEELLPYFDISKVQVRERPRPNTVETLFELMEHQDLFRFRAALTRVSLREVSEKSVRGHTCLQKAVVCNLPSFVSALLKVGVNPNHFPVENPVRPLLLACYRGHYQVLSVFVKELDSKAGKGSKVPPNFAVWTRDTQETALHMVLKKSLCLAQKGLGSDAELSVWEDEYRKCLDLLLSSEEVKTQLGRVVNKKDNIQNTALHYAAHLWSQKEIAVLLRLGANIGVRNMRDEVPLSEIHPETLEEFLNDCVTHHKHPLEPEFQVEFNYSWLAPPVDDYNSEEWDQSRQDELEKKGLPETESLWHMSQSKPHRHLLRHPTVTSFLWLKWQRVRRFFSRNIRMNILFVTCLTWYIFQRFGGVALNASKSQGNITDPHQFCRHPRVDSGVEVGFWYVVFVLTNLFLLVYTARDLMRECKCRSGKDIMKAFISSWLDLILAGLVLLVLILGAGALWYVLTILLAILALKEIFQMSASLRRYFISLENLLEISMLGLLCVLLFAGDELDVAEEGGEEGEEGEEGTDCAVRRHIAAVCILFSWTELIILVAKHPKLSSYNVYLSMFYKVLRTFCLFLVWYSFFIIAFALGFYIMLHKDIPRFQPGADHYVYFDSPWTSLVKTSTMFVGELEFSDIPIDTDNKIAWFSFSYLLVFVFFIVVILANLLNGLAVSDTGIIMDEAEIVSYIARVETISELESILLGDPFGFLSNWPKLPCPIYVPSLALWHQVYSTCPGARRAGHALTGATGILLFYSLLPEKKYQFPAKYEGFCQRELDDIPLDIVRSARDLALRKEQVGREEEDAKLVNNKILRLLESQQLQIQTLHTQLKLVLAARK